MVLMFQLMYVKLIILGTKVFPMPPNSVSSTW